MKSDSQRYHIGCKKKKTQQIVPALLTAYGGVMFLRCTVEFFPEIYYLRKHRSNIDIFVYWSVHTRCVSFSINCISGT